MPALTEMEEETTVAPPSIGLPDTLPKKNGGEPNFEEEKVVAFIGPGVEFKGVINYKGSVRIDGRLEGEIHTEGSLLVGKEAILAAKISAGSVVSKGQITGDIVAKEKVLLLSSAHMDGSLNTPQLSIEEGVIFNGTIEMNKQGMR